MVHIKDKIEKHIKGNSILYIIILMAFMIGIASGAFTINTLNDIQRESIMKYISNFYNIIGNTKINSLEVFKQSILNSFETTFILWLLGATIIGIPFIFFVIGIRGFVLGFSIGFLISELNYKGIVISLLAVLPQNIIILIAIFFIAVTCVNFSLYILKNRRFSISNLFSQFVSYTLIIYAAFAVMIIGGIIEAYITPSTLYFFKSFIK